MNPFINYGYQYSQGQPYNWYPHYYSSAYGGPQEYYNYYTHQPYSYPQRNFYSNYEFNEHKKTQPEIIKLEQDSSSNLKNPPNNYSNEPKKVNKKSKKKLVLPRLSQTDKNIYVHPPKEVKNRVKYFDPSSAPVVTSSFYNLVEDLQKQEKRNEQIYLLNEENPNELLFPQLDNQEPFIKFRFRRIKKKFKKYIKPKDEFYYEQKSQVDEQENDYDNSSLSSQQDSDYDYSRNRRKSRKNKTSIVKEAQKKEINAKVNQQVLNIESSQAVKSRDK